MNTPVVTIRPDSIVLEFDDGRCFDVTQLIKDLDSAASELVGATDIELEAIYNASDLLNRLTTRLLLPCEGE